MNTPAQTIARQLAEIGTGSAFATRFSVEADPGLHVEGVGRIALPLPLQTAHRLCAVARPAHHGYKDQTRLDPRVRDTWEIPTDRIRFESPEWPAVIKRALVRIGRELGLPSETHLEAELHNLLVYAPGQFFAVHQDSEKRDGMLGTLVVTLPSRFTGGEFVVSHQGHTLRNRGSASRLGMLAFYADCHHEVRPVKQGYRVALTYNLIRRGDTPATPIAVRDVEALASTLRVFWQTPPAPRWTGDRRSEPPDRLVYLLDHQYTPNALGWSQLKGADVPRVAALRQAATLLDAEIFLTLADVHEVWSAEDDDPAYDEWNFTEDEEALDDEPVNDVTLQELIDSDIELRQWQTLDGSDPAFEFNMVAESELCCTRPSVDCAPFQTEYEGYMGNYGNTQDRWYHRAAVVIWPRQRAFIIRARQSPQWAIAQIAAQLEAREVSEAQASARLLLPFWQRAATVADASPLLDDCLAVAEDLDDAETAAALLAPFTLARLMPQMAPRLPRLLDRYGLEWCRQRLETWADSCRSDDEQRQWLVHTLPALTESRGVTATPAGQALAAALVEQRWHWLRHSLDVLLARTTGSTTRRVMTDTAPALLGILRSSANIRQPQQLRSIVDQLRLERWPLELPLAALHRAAEETIPAALQNALAPLHAHCTQALEARLAHPERAHEDWSIAVPTACSGEPQETLARFLAAPDQKRLEWPLAQAGRQVIHQFIDRHELPVRHQTRRSGRPYTLVLEKTPALFELEAAERHWWADELNWLRQTQT